MMSLPCLEKQQVAGRLNKIVFETSTNWRSREKPKPKKKKKKITVPTGSNTALDGVAGEEL